MNFNWESIQQVVRIILYTACGFLVNGGLITEDMRTTLVGAGLGIGSVLWWILWERKRTVA